MEWIPSFLKPFLYRNDVCYNPQWSLPHLSHFLDWGRKFKKQVRDLKYKACLCISLWKALTRKNRWYFYRKNKSWCMPWQSQQTSGGISLHDHKETLKCNLKSHLPEMEYCNFKPDYLNLPFNICLKWSTPLILSIADERGKFSIFLQQYTTLNVIN